jgi:hypothetical protein
MFADNVERTNDKNWKMMMPVGVSGFGVFAVAYVIFFPFRSHFCARSLHYLLAPRFCSALNYDQITLRLRTVTQCFGELLREGMLTVFTGCAAARSVVAT